MTRAEATLSQALADMKNRQGVSLGDLTPGELLRLVRACERVAEPFREINADAAGFPVRVCEGWYFWKLTIGAAIWLDEVEAMLPDGIRNDQYRLALIYACLNARNPDAFAGLDTPRKVGKAVKSALRKMPATPDEVNLALDILFRQKADDRKRDSITAASDWAALCTRLESQSGIPAKTWMWEHSSSYAVKCYHDLNEFARALTAKSGSQRMLDELDAAVNALQLLKLQIMKRVKDGN